MVLVEKVMILYLPKWFLNLIYLTFHLIFGSSMNFSIISSACWNAKYNHNTPTHFKQVSAYCKHYAYFGEPVFNLSGPLVLAQFQKNRCNMLIKFKKNIRIRTSKLLFISYSHISFWFMWNFQKTVVNSKQF